MKTQILGRVRQQSEDWLAEAYKSGAAFCAIRAVSKAEALDKLDTEIQRVLVALAQPWLKRWQGSPGVVNCSESKVKLPIDMWYCKLKDTPCPIQGQVFLDHPEQFFQGCLVSSERKRQIFDTVATGKYEGFHHVPGRYLCVSCEHEGRNGSVGYHYPWELTLFSAYCPLFEHDGPEIRQKLLIKGINLTSASIALCAVHAKQLATQIDPDLGAQFTIRKFSLFR